MSPPPLTSFTTLSFDCFGTLIDWELGLQQSLSPLLSSLPPSHPWNLTPLLAVQAFNAHSEHLWHTQPSLSYPSNLSQSLLRLAAEADIPVTPEVQKAADDVATAPGRWPAFEDSVAALKVLKRHFKLVILSNVDEDNISRVVGPGGALDRVAFDKVYTAEKIGSYKPDHRNFDFLFEGVERELGGKREGVLHVARSLTADHVPAKELGLSSVWIARGGDKPEGYGTGGDYSALKAEGKLGFGWLYQTLGEFASAVEREFEGRK